MRTSPHPPARAFTLVLALLLAVLVPLTAAGAQPADGVIVVGSAGDADDAVPGSHGCDTHPADNGLEPPECTLRAAIQEANALPGTQTIVFDIDGAAPHVITPATLLPEVTDPVVIDATYGAQGPEDHRLIELDGSAIVDHEENGLLISAGGSTVRGLAIHGFSGTGDSNGIMLIGGDGNTIAGNWFGLRADGTPGGWLGDDAIEVTWDGDDPSDGNLIGGAAAADRNVIARSDDDGVDLATSDNTVRGNYIGIGPDGTTAAGNEDAGVVVDAENDVPHGPTGNDIVANVIGANGDDGIQIESDGNLVRGNLVGVAVDGTTPRGNGDEGIEVTGSDNLIGSSPDAADPTADGNLVAYNAEVGIEVEDGTGNRILGNRIHANGMIAIDLDVGGDGVVTPNDAGDGDVGPNDLQNFPVLDAATTAEVTGRLDSAPDATYTVELFANGSCDPSGHGEAERLLRRTTVETDGTGAGSFTVALTGDAVTAGEHVTATATSAVGNTSELSSCASVVAAEPHQEFCADAPAEPFRDVRPNSTHGPAIACLASLAITVGITQDTYGPTHDISRGQVASLVARSLDWAGIELPDGDDAFDDDDGSTHEQAIDRLAAAGILHGFDDGTFGPTAPITRAQVAAVVARAASLSGLRLPASPDAFDDDDGSVHEADIDRLAAAGIVRGVGERRYRPEIPISRAETASLLVRWLETWQARA